MSNSFPCRRDLRIQVAPVPSLPLCLLPAKVNASCHLLPWLLCRCFSSRAECCVPVSSGSANRKARSGVLRQTGKGISLGWECEPALRLQCAHQRSVCLAPRTMSPPEAASHPPLRHLGGQHRATLSEPGFLLLALDVGKHRMNQV